MELFEHTSYDTIVWKTVDKLNMICFQIPIMPIYLVPAEVSTTLIGQQPDSKLRLSAQRWIKLFKCSEYLCEYLKVPVLMNICSMFVRFNCYEKLK